MKGSASSSAVRLAALACVALGGMGQGVVAPKLPELFAGSPRLSFDAGLSAALMYLGIFVSTRAYGALTDRGAVHRLLGLGLVGYALTLAALAASTSHAALFAARLAEGFCLSAVYVAADYLLVRLSPASERGRWLSYYGVALSAGLLLGPVLALGWPRLTGQTDPRAPLLGLALPVAAAGLAALVALRVPRLGQGPPPKRGGLDRGALAAGAAYGFMESALVAVFPVLAVTEFKLKPELCLVITIVCAGVSSVGWGWLADRHRPRPIVNRLLAGLALAPLGLLLLTHIWVPGGLEAASVDTRTGLGLLACGLFGSLAGGLYPLGFAWLVEDLPATQYGFASGAFARAYGIGSLGGPLLAGIASQYRGASGLWLVLSVAGALGRLGGWLEERRSR